MHVADIFTENTIPKVNEIFKRNFDLLFFLALIS